MAVYNTEDIIKAFEYGIDYGLLIAEQERDSEDLFDAVACMVYSQKRNVPSTPAPRRQSHSEAWRRVKKKALMDFIDLVKEKCVCDNKYAADMRTEGRT